MPISQWPVQERPREKLLSRGARQLSDAELLALFIGTGSRGRNAVELGQELLAGCGGLAALLNTESELPRVRGLGTAKQCRLKAIIELARRASESALCRGTGLRNPGDSAQFLEERLAGYPYEVFAAIFLDNRHRVLAFEEMFRGTIDSASVHPREVVRACIRHNAAAVIFAHNHPSGVPEPSEADRAITAELTRAMSLIGVRVLDHFVVGAGCSVSLAERGML
ncbi:RadC family protein [Tahibacter amnicola]|uniref:DNA repair protein RadC n=1 Tax=Tahibacter amnicola TaxID=2976241 RepID=A0ABY6BE06_9GAMM|nr:DNA repair protein RadC [Tahibacter amnicola]UXI68253.1 DNA repair protein RadC [Tahibacter amnicola]